MVGWGRTHGCEVLWHAYPSRRCRWFPRGEQRELPDGQYGCRSLRQKTRVGTVHRGELRCALFVRSRVDVARVHAIQRDRSLHGNMDWRWRELKPPERAVRASHVGPRSRGSALLARRRNGSGRLSEQTRQVRCGKAQIVAALSRRRTCRNQWRTRVLSTGCVRCRNEQD